MHPFVSQFMGENRESLCRWKTFGDRDFAFSRDTFDSVSQYFFVQRDAIRTNQTFQRAQELARISYELMLSRAAQPQAAAANAAAQAAQQNGPGTEERAAGSSPAPLSTPNVELLGGMGNVRARSSSRSERRAAANLTEAQQLALFSGGN